MVERQLYCALIGRASSGPVWSQGGAGRARQQGGGGGQTEEGAGHQQAGEGASGESGQVRQNIFNNSKYFYQLKIFYSQTDQQLGQLRQRLGQLEQELGEREAVVRQQEEAVRQLQETKERLSQEVATKQALVEKRETTIKKLSGEILKANEIISKLQEGVRQEQDKTKLRGHIAQEQEKLLFDRDRELGECREQLRESKQVIEELNIRQADLERTEEEKRAKIEELEKTIRTNENVINWLNKQLNPENESTAKKSPGLATSKRAGGGGGGGGRARQPLTKVSHHLARLDNKTELGTEPPTGGLDPKYFLQSTPGGTKYRHEIPSQLPPNVARGGGLVRREIR